MDKRTDCIIQAGLVFRPQKYDIRRGLSQLTHGLRTLLNNTRTDKVSTGESIGKYKKPIKKILLILKDDIVLTACGVV